MAGRVAVTWGHHLHNHHPCILMLLVLVLVMVQPWAHLKEITITGSPKVQIMGNKVVTVKVHKVVTVKVHRVVTGRVTMNRGMTTRAPVNLVNIHTVVSLQVTLKVVVPPVIQGTVSRINMVNH